jgi:uncharacterized protein
MIGKLTSEEIEEVLKQNILGRIGCNDGKKTYVVPVNYVYDGRSIIAHSCEGMKIKMMRKNSDVCFEVDEMKTASSWKSVIAWGEFQELTEERSRYDAMKLFIQRMLPLKITAPVATAHSTGNKGQASANLANHRSVIYRIVLTEKTGRFENCTL